MNHGIDGQRQAGLYNGLADLQLAIMTATETGDLIGIHRVDVLKAQLDMIQPRAGKRCELRLIEQHARGYKVGIETEAGAVSHQFS